MRKVTFYIDDLSFFQKYYSFSDEQMDSIFEDKKSFRVIYILYGRDNQQFPDRYEITDYDGNKIDYNSLNGYERGVVLNDCYAYYTGGKYHSGISAPCGVVDIVEEVIEDEG